VISKEQYLAVKAAFKAQKSHSAADHMIYNILRSYPADRGFTPISNKTKLDNGQRPNQAFESAKLEIEYQLRSQKYLASLKEKFGIEFSEDLINKIKEQVK
jgi:GTP-binding protein EngB required for normal cell division